MSGSMSIDAMIIATSGRGPPTHIVPVPQQGAPVKLECFQEWVEMGERATFWLSVRAAHSAVQRNLKGLAQVAVS